MSYRNAVLRSTLATALSCCSLIATAEHKNSGKTNNKDTVEHDNAIVVEAPFAVKQLENTVITGQYKPSDATKAVQKIQIIDRKKLDMMGAQNLKDALNNQLGITIAQDPALGSTMSMQGISGQNVKILIDGVAVIGRTDGNLDISQLNLNNIERIEIVEGPMAVNYGTDALAGTINLITKKAKPQTFNAGLTTYSESIGTYNINGSMALHKNAQSLIISGGRNLFDGWNPGDKPFDLSFSAQPANASRYKLWNPKEQYFTDIQYGYSFKNVTINYKLTYFNETITNRSAPVDYYDERGSDDYYHTRRLDNAVFLNTNLTRNKKLNLQVSYNNYRRLKNTFITDLTTLNKTQDVPENQDTSFDKQFSSRGSYNFTNEHSKINYEAGYDINVETGTGQRVLGTTKTIGDYALFTSAEYKPVNSLIIRPGLRYAYNSAYNAPLLPSLNIRSKLIGGVTLRASYAKGFRAPTVKELYFNFHDSNHDIDGNAELKPEESDNFTTNLQYNFRPENWFVTIEGGGFYNNIRNKIELAQTGSATQYTYINIGLYQSKAATVAVTARYKGISLGAGALYLGRYNNLYNEGYGVSKFAYTPEVNGNIMYDMRHYGLSAAVFFKYTGKSPGFSLVATTDAEGNKVNRAVANDISAYSLTDVTLTKQLYGKRLKLTVGCKNIFNVQNVNRLAAGTSSSPHSSGSTQLYIANGRNYFLGLNLNLHSND